MREDGKSIVLITHRLEEIAALVDEVTVLRDGKMIGTCRAEGITKEELTRMMVGRDVMFEFPPLKQLDLGVKLSIRDLSADNDRGLPALKHFSLDIHAGEIVGIAGVDGNGQNELCEVLTGLREQTDGEILLNGADATNKKPIYYIDEKVSYIPEDRLTTGLALNWNLKKNMILKSIGSKTFTKHGLMDEKRISEHWNNAQKEYQIKAIDGDEAARSLSGGNQQKLILARELNAEPEVLIANQPTRGLDIGASEYVRQKLIEARNNGAAVLVVSADLEEIMQVSDRIAVIYNGELMGILPRGADVYEVGSLMMGKRQEVQAHE